jgi:hypothetical protein
MKRRAIPSAPLRFSSTPRNLVKDPDQAAQSTTVAPIVAAFVSVTPIAHLIASVLAIVFISIVSLFPAPIVPPAVPLTNVAIRAASAFPT